MPPIFHKDSAIATNTLTWINPIDQRGLLYAMQFEIDPLFVLKICLTINRAIQLFLASCQESESYVKVGVCYLNFEFDQECIDKGSFASSPRSVRGSRAKIPRQIP